MNVSSLLSNVSTITNSIDTIKKHTGGHFNIFHIAKIDQLEVTICRVLFDLLNPKGSHFQGDLFLKEFIAVVGLKFSEVDYETVQIFREYLIKDDRRIDLFITTKNFHIPIEVKINAMDQKNQCNDYFKHAKNSKLLYLTKYGSNPSTESLGSVSIDEVECLSFREHIIDWLERCLTKQTIIKLAPIREVLLQFINAIKSFINEVGDEEMEKIEQLLSKNSESMKSALLIAQGVNNSRISLLKKVFQSFEDQINLNKLNIPKDYSFNNDLNLERYYRTNIKNKVLPGLHYLYKKDFISGSDLCFFIEVDHYFYAGFYLNGEKKQINLTNEHFKNVLPHLNEVNLNDPLIHWQYLTLNPQEKGPNFAEAGLEENYLNLFDEENFKQFIVDCLSGIEKIFGKSLTTII